MKKIWYLAPVIIAILCAFYFMPKFDGTIYYSALVIIFALNGLGSLFLGILSIKKYNTISIFLILIGVVSLFVFYTIVAGWGYEARPRGPSAVVKASITSIRAQAEILYDEGGFHSYQMVCDDKVVKSLLKEAQGYGGRVKCFSDVDSFVATGEFKKPEGLYTHWCADSTGESKEITTLEDSQIINSDTLCPI